jgi:hypothetical protein
MFVLILLPLIAFGGSALLGREMRRYDDNPRATSSGH